MGYLVKLYEQTVYIEDEALYTNVDKVIKVGLYSEHIQQLTSITLRFK